MTTYIVTAANWDTPSFWTAISEAGPGHTLDLSALPSSFEIGFWPANNQIIASNGETDFIIGDINDGGSNNARMGGTTQRDYFTTAIGSDGNDMMDVVVHGGDTLYWGNGSDLIVGGGGHDVIVGGSGTVTIGGGDGESGPNNTAVKDGNNLQGATAEDAFLWAGGAGHSATIRFNNSVNAGDGDGVADFVAVTNPDDTGVLTVGDFDVGTDKIFIQQRWTGINTSSSSGFQTFTLTYANGNQQTIDIYHDDSTTVTASAVFSANHRRLPPGRRRCDVWRR